MAKLTDKQRKLVQGKVKGLTHKEAYLKAGYSAKMKDKAIENEVRKTLAKPLVKKYYEELQKEVVETAEKGTIASAQEIQELLTELARGDAVEHVITSDGMYEKPTANKDRIKALELLGKTHAIFTDKQEITAEVKTNPILESIASQLVGDDDDEVI